MSILLVWYHLQSYFCDLQTIEKVVFICYKLKISSLPESSNFKQIVDIRWTLSYL